MSDLVSPAPLSALLTNGSGFRELQQAMFRRTTSLVSATLILVYYALIFAQPD